MKIKISYLHINGNLTNEPPDNQTLQIHLWTSDGRGFSASRRLTKPLMERGDYWELNRDLEILVEDLNKQLALETEGDTGKAGAIIHTTGYSYLMDALKNKSKKDKV